MSRHADQLALRIAPRPDAALWTGRLLVVILVLTVITLVAAPWTQTTRGSGRVVAYAPVERQQTLQAPVEGRIVRWHVLEGSRVKAGDPIVDIADLDPQLVLRLTQERDATVARLGAAQSRVEAISSRLGRLGGARSAGLDAAGHRSSMATSRAHAAEEAQAAAVAAERTAKLNVERIEALEKAGLRSRRDLELAQLDEIRTRTDSARAVAAAEAARSEQTALSADRSKYGNDGAASLDDARASQASAQAEIASATAELARIEVKLSRQGTQAVKAPRDGTILRLLASNEAEMLKAGAPLALFVPDTESRAVELWIDGNDVPLVAVDRKVRLQFEGWPAVQFAGWPSVAVGTFGGIVRLVDSHDDGKGKFRVLVTPDAGEAWPSGVFLRQGTRAHGWILLNRVRLGYELWRQFNGFPPVVASDEAAALKKGEK